MPKTNFLRYIIFAYIFICLSEEAVSQIRPALIFGDNGVLQRGIEVPIWGTAKKNTPLRIGFKGKEYKARTDKNGKWRIMLPSMQAGGPYDMTIKGENEKVIIKNLMVGDVWVCSGQSNMEWQLSMSAGAKEEIAGADQLNIRHFKVPKSFAWSPQDQLEGGTWQESNAETAGNFTAVGYHFAKVLSSSEKVTIGLLNTSWGGSRIEPWMNTQALGYDDTKTLQQEIREERNKKRTQLVSFLKSKLNEIPEKDEGIVNQKPVWAHNNLDDQNWLQMDLPGLWENQGWQGLDGIVWFRKEVNLSKDDIQTNLTLSLGPIDDTDQTWVNGHLIGGLENSYNIARNYNVPKEYLIEGKNIITVRVIDTGGGGGIYGHTNDLYLKTPKRTLPLAGKWKYEVGEVYLDIYSNNNQVPTLLYNKMIHPLLRFPIKGVIWYQGESNADNKQDALEYKIHFRNMIQSWRKEWGDKQFPFLWVQLANFTLPKDLPGESNWALLRESQSAALDLPNTGQAVIIDIGEAEDIHPKNKHDVGYRLALAAQKLSYGKDIIYSGPTFKSMEIKENKAFISFDHVGSGLLARDKYQYLRGFAIAGSDKQFKWAKAYIKNNRVVVYHDKIEKPIVVRYAWADNPEDANLYNKEGLPASPFRTDREK